MLFHYKRKRITTMTNDELLAAIDEAEKDIEVRSAVVFGKVAEDQKYLSLKATSASLKNEFMYRKKAKMINNNLSKEK